MIRTYKAALSEELSVYEPRYVIVDIESGRVLDDAQGYGYRSEAKAYAGYSYKASNHYLGNQEKAKRNSVLKWCRKHEKVVEYLSNMVLLFEQESVSSERSYVTSCVQDCLEALGYTDLPFTAEEFLRYW